MRQPSGRQRDHARQQAGKASDHQFVEPAPEDAADGRRRHAVRQHADDRSGQRRQRDDRVDARRSLDHTDPALLDVARDRVEARQLAQIDVPGEDANQVRVLLFRWAERRENRRRCGEELRLESKAIGHPLQGVLEGIGREAVAVQRATEAQHEADGRGFFDRVHGRVCDAHDVLAARPHDRLAVRARHWVVADTMTSPSTMSSIRLGSPTIDPTIVKPKSRRTLSTRLMKIWPSPVSGPRVEMPTVPRT